MDTPASKAGASVPLLTSLIGYSGFVGSNLARQHTFNGKFNSKNIDELRGREVDLLVCAGVSAVKWLANKNPKEDWANIEALLDVLKTVRPSRFVLISTIDVYPNPFGVTERSSIAGVPNHAYGEHRRAIEEFVAERFAVHHIVRLPGLFGVGLKKNVIFDLVHDNCLDAINPASSFQYYDLKHLWTDLSRIIEADLPLVNIASEPITTQEIIDAFFPCKLVGAKAGPEAHYDMRTDFSDYWDSKSSYQYSKDQVLKDLGDFIRVARPA